MKKFLDSLANAWLFVLLAAIVIVMTYGAYLSIKEDTNTVWLFIGGALTVWSIHRMDVQDKEKKHLEESK